MDELACEAAEENIAKNGVGDRVRVLNRVVGDGGPLPHAPFDGIVANLQTQIILPLLSDFVESLCPEGWLILSGVLLDERADVLNAAVRERLLPADEDMEERWWSGLFRLPGPVD